MCQMREGLPMSVFFPDSPGWSSEGGYEPAPPVPEKRFDLEEEKTQGAAAPDHMMSSSVTSASSEKGPASPRSPHLSAQPAASGSTPSPTSPAPSQSASTEIQAALAISGRTPANEEMPYMTPPLHHVSIGAPVSCLCVLLLLYARSYLYAGSYVCAWCLFIQMLLDPSHLFLYRPFYFSSNLKR